MVVCPRDRKAFAAEVFIQKETSEHPNVVTFYNAYSHNGFLMVILEYMEAGALTDVLDLYGTGVIMIEEHMAYVLMETLKVRRRRKEMGEGLTFESFFLNTFFSLFPPLFFSLLGS